ncbi:hypothetical protein [Kitasatospora sp. NPDC001547]|uniref:hypothetical protein n=1 Tax=Kitasatospora sp. NPDC001547 TaxID=3364015 RepID=UPI0036AE9E74
MTDKAGNTGMEETSRGRQVFWRALTVGAALTCAVSGALLFWSWGSTLAPLPVLPLWITGAVGLVVAVAASFGIRDGDGTPLPTVGTALLILTLWLGASAADLAASGVRDWVRTPQAVTATVTECRTESSFHENDTVGFDHVACLYHWTFNGDERTGRLAGDSHPDGTRVGMWMSPKTGELAEHPLFALIGYTAGALGAAAIVLVGGWFRLRTEACRLLGRPVTP